MNKDAKLLRITEKDAKRLRLALILSCVFVFLNINLSLGYFPISISFIIVAIFLGRITPLSEEELMDEGMGELNESRVMSFHEWRDADPARKYMSKKDQIKSFKDQGGRL
jgi:hypothetical protein